MEVVLLWTFVNSLSFFFATVGSIKTLPRRYGRKRTITLWGLFYLVDFLSAGVTYSLNILNDFPVCAIHVLLLLIGLFLFCKSNAANRFFVCMSASLFIAVFTFLFCGTTDQIMGQRLGLFDPVAGPYTVRNILFFTAVKAVVLSLSTLLYLKLFRIKVRKMIKEAGVQMRYYAVVAIISYLGFLVINYVANNVGIIPTSPYFLPMYITVCLIFGMEYVQMYSSVHWMNEAAKAGRLGRMDGLTGLHNRLAFEEEEKAINEKLKEGGTSFGVVMIDLNYLKKINDTFGHDKGDIAIMKLADHIKLVFSDCECYRIGGDEFTVILDASLAEDTEKLVERFRAQVAGEEGTELWKKVSAAAGFSVFDPKTDREFDDVFKRADQDMYQNKAKMKAAK